MRQIFRLVIAMIIITFILLPPLANGGSEPDPEITDGSDDLPYNFLDIESAWFDGPDGETESTLDITLKMVDGPKNIQDFWEDVQAGNVTTFDFEVYFDFNGTNYALAATVDAAFTSNILGAVVYGTQELRMGDYDSNGNIKNESTITQIEMEWDGDLKAMAFTVQKSSIGSPKVGNIITNPWAAVWNVDEYPSNAPRSLVNAEDTAGSHINPGRDFKFKGGFEFEYALSLHADATTKMVKPGQIASFLVTINASTTNVDDDVEVSARFVMTKPNWTVEANFQSRNITDQAVQIPINVTVNCPKEEVNGSFAKITVYVKLMIPEANNTYLAEQLKLTVIVYGEYEQEEDKTAMEEFLELIMEPMILSIIVGILMVVILASILAKRM
jgi:hypothetical protein